MQHAARRSASPAVASETPPCRPTRGTRHRDPAPTGQRAGTPAHLSPPHRFSGPTCLRVFLAPPLLCRHPLPLPSAHSRPSASQPQSPDLLHLSPPPASPRALNRRAARPESSRASPKHLSAASPPRAAHFGRVPPPRPRCALPPPASRLPPASLSACSGQRAARDPAPRSPWLTPCSRLSRPQHSCLRRHRGHESGKPPGAVVGGRPKAQAPCGHPAAHVGSAPRPTASPGAGRGAPWAGAPHPAWRPATHPPSAGAPVAAVAHTRAHHHGDRPESPALTGTWAEGRVWPAASWLSLGSSAPPSPCPGMQTTTQQELKLCASLSFSVCLPLAL